MQSLARPSRGCRLLALLARPSRGCRLLALLVVAGAGVAWGEGSPALPESLKDLDAEVRSRIVQATEAVTERPSAAGEWIDLGHVYHAHLFPRQAATCYQKALDLQSANAKAWYALAHARAELGELESAVEALAEARKHEPAYAPIHWRLGDWLLELGRVEAADAAFRQAIRVDPNDAGGHVGLARVLVTGGEPGQAVPVLQRALALDPLNGVAAQLLGGALRAMGDEKAARRTLALATGRGAWFPDPWYEEILDQAAGVGNRLRLVSGRLARGETERALAELEALHRDHPDDVGVLNKLAEAHLARGVAEPALQVLARAIELVPDEFATLIHLAQAERLRGNLKEALIWADRAVAANGSFWQAHFTRAGLLHRSGRLEEAIEAVEEAMRRGGHQSPDAWLMKGDAELQLGRWAEAAETFGTAAERFPFLAQAFVGRAYADLERGEIDSARSALDTAAELAPGDPTAAALRTRLPTTTP